MHLVQIIRCAQPFLIFADRIPRLLPEEDRLFADSADHKVDQRLTNFLVYSSYPISFKDQIISPLISLSNLTLKVSPYYMSPPSPDATLTLTRNPRTLIGTREKLRCGKWRENWRAAGADGSHFRRGATIPAGRGAGTWTTFPVDELTLDDKSPIPKLAPILTPYGCFQRTKDSLDRDSVLI